MNDGGSGEETARGKRIGSVGKLSGSVNYRLAVAAYLGRKAAELAKRLPARPACSERIVQCSSARSISTHG